MRKAFVNALVDIASRDDRLIVLVADTGAIMFDEFRAKYPDRFINCGIAEQNMVGVAAGMALCGFLPVIYGITPFVLFRCYEQVRNDVSLQNAPVLIVGAGDEETYKQLGPTHYAKGDEDWFLMENMPGHKMYYWCETAERVQYRTTEFGLNPKPTYFRLGKR